MKKTEKRTFRVPHQLIIMLAIAAIATLATYVIPAGAYEQIEINGRKAIDAASFHYIDQTPVGPWQAFLALPGGFSKQVSIIAMITMIAGAIGVINETKCIDASIGKLVSKYKNNLYIIVPLLLGVFTILGTMGINTPIIAFVPIALILGRSLGGDALVGVTLVLMGEICGQAGGAFCTSSTAVAQELVGLEIFTGWQLRIIASVVLWAVGSVFLIRYVQKIRKDPTKSILHGVEGVAAEADGSSEEAELTPRRIGALITFIIGFGVLVYGATHGWSTADAIPAVFMLTAIACGLISGFSPDKIAKEFVKGAKTMTGAALVVAFATGINTILSSGNIIHTIVHAMASLFSGGSAYVSAIGMYISNLLINFVLCSSSSQATTVIPIFSGVGDVLGLTQQTVVQTFNFGDAFTNLVTPVSSVLMGCIGCAGVPWDRWLKFAWKWLLVFIAIGGVFIMIGVGINYGPF
ncbi:MAG: hypothetical protein K2P04_01475 [Oscillospiraceae bacterium]|uniref:YfcC family protein n=1 Tax=uncultured Oscillibacter sp. TaxID=876091 RepID=UPI00216EE543|nr:Na+/H+ antiporter NhaC family protein [uncultured Oscillibacter sp.]MCI8740610.1 YfcC family protein [Oscillibacter sp.]MCX4372786.1 hypothetical protein [Dysosmobacter sp.]MDE6996532.1 hypothetical protein [Oscillospiraceae bacterium]